MSKLNKDEYWAGWCLGSITTKVSPSKDYEQVATSMKNYFATTNHEDKFRLGKGEHCNVVKVSIKVVE